MVPSFMTWKSTNRSMVSSRKAVSVISFSGSSSNGCTGQRQSDWSRQVVAARAYLALEQRSDLVLHALCLAQEALFYRQALQPALAPAHVVDLGRAILDGTSEQIFRVGADVVSLGLYCWAQCQQSVRVHRRRPRCTRVAPRAPGPVPSPSRVHRGRGPRWCRRAALAWRDVPSVK